MMEVLTSVDEGSFARAVAKQWRADYVYMYPPRQAYRRIERQDVHALIDDSLQSSAKINLYFHFPFCRQICSYCNLFAVPVGPDPPYALYVSSLCAEVQRFAAAIRQKNVDTIYLGGGTPSLLRPEDFETLFTFLRTECGVWCEDVPEVAIEVAPDTVDPEKFRRYSYIGINRVNIGLQSATSAELHGIGRRHGATAALRAIEILQTVGFKNICIDLIYGLEGQSTESWVSSIATVIGLRPNTICTYALTVRPFTSYGVRGYFAPTGAVQYERYDIARQLLLDAGYVQESPVRYVCGADGGYRQKRNHWAGENVLGFGAGARSYLYGVDLRNGYSVKHRTRNLAAYLERVKEGHECWTDGFVMTEEERARKTLVLGLECLNKTSFRSDYALDASQEFEREFQILLRTGMLTDTGDAWRLTERGIRFRDLSMQLFFSKEVRDRLGTFSYEE